MRLQILGHVLVGWCVVANASLSARSAPLEARVGMLAALASSDKRHASSTDAEKLSQTMDVLVYHDPRRVFQTKLIEESEAFLGSDMPLPENLVMSPMMRRLVTAMLRRSPTFRRQCARLAQRAGVVMSIELVARLVDVGADSRLTRESDRLTVVTRIDMRQPTLFAELIAHELEHVLEQLDGIDLPQLARQRLDGVVKQGARYETARADWVGRVVAREVVAP